MARPISQRNGSNVLVLDMGTSSLHCLVADSMGNPVATASTPISYYTPDDCSSLAKEFDPDLTMDKLGQLTAKALRDGDIDGDSISAIGICSQRQGMVFLDNNGREVYSGPNVDLRAFFEGAEIDEQHGKEIYRITGHTPSFLLAPARLQWFRKNRAPVYEKTRSVLTIAGWLAYRLTGSLLCEPSLEAEAGLLDLNSRDRSPDLMDKLGVPLSLLPPTNTSSGTLQNDVAASWGLNPGIPVIVAGADTQCGLLGMGLRHEGEAGAILGWSGALQMVTSRPCFDKRMRTWVGCHVVEGAWIAESNLGDSGNSYRWLKDTLLGSQATFEEAEKQAREAPVAPNEVFSLTGPGPASSFRSGLRLGGLLFPTPLSFQETTRGQLFRAALENLSYSVKSNLGILAEVTGLCPQVLYLGGGMADSHTLAATLANVLGFSVRRSKITQVSARGAALVAASYASRSRTLEQALEAAALDYDQIDPGSASEIVQYAEGFSNWLRLYERLEWDQD